LYRVWRSSSGEARPPARQPSRRAARLCRPPRASFDGALN